MSADSLYHAFGLKGYSVHAIRHENNEIVLKTRHPRESLRYSACGSARVFFKTSLSDAPDRHADEEVTKLFRLIHLNRVFELQPDRDMALAQFS